MNDVKYFYGEYLTAEIIVKYQRSHSDHCREAQFRQNFAENFGLYRISHWRQTYSGEKIVISLKEKVK